MNKKSGKYLLLDTEFSGPNPAKNGLTEIACLILDKDLNEVAEYETVVCPPKGIEYDAESMAVSGFSIQEILEKGISYEDVLTDIRKLLEEYFDELPICIGHFYPSEFMYLNDLFDRVGEHREIWKKVGNDFLDTKVLINLANLKAQQKGEVLPFPVSSLYKPGGLRDVLKITDLPAHRAMNDVKATYIVLKKLVDCFDFSLDATC